MHAISLDGRRLDHGGGHGRERLHGPGDLVLTTCSAGATNMPPAFMMVGVSAIDGAEQEMQSSMLRLRYASVPTVSAIRGLALGGGCEMAVYSNNASPPWRVTSVSWRWGGPGARLRWFDLHRPARGGECRYQHQQGHSALSHGVVSTAAAMAKVGVPVRLKAASWVICWTRT